MKLHVGCGAVYLDGWVNVDLPSGETFLAADRPDLVERWRTTDDSYYAKHQDKNAETLRDGPLTQEYVCDRYGSFEFLPVRDGEVNEFLARHCFEHLSIAEAHRALDSIYRVMAVGGLIRIDVPDHEATLHALVSTGDQFYVRHLLGPRRNEHGYHMMSYTRDRLIALCESHGLTWYTEEPNIHFYPAFCLGFYK